MRVITSEYPLFIPPTPLAIKAAKEWSRIEADRYFAWLMGELPNRTEELLEYLDVSANESREHTLHEAGKALVKLLPDHRFSERTTAGPKLTSEGYALAADAGLLVARFLIEACAPRVRWEVLQKPKREIAYNLPVLIGFDSNYLEPIGGFIAEAYGILRGLRDGGVLMKAYDFWKKKAAQQPH